MSISEEKAKGLIFRQTIAGIAAGMKQIESTETFWTHEDLIHSVRYWREALSQALERASLLAAVDPVGEAKVDRSTRGKDCNL